jgi:FkbM family methyltransferase
MSIFKRVALAAVGRTPAGLRAWVYRHPAVWNPLARMIGRLVPMGAATVVQVRVGPNAGLKLAIDRTTPRYYWLDPNYESAVVSVLREWLRPGMVVADIGAHIGFMTMLMARTVGASGKVLSIEPSPPAAAQLRENVRLNELANVTVRQVAVSDAAGEANFVILPHATTNHLAPADGAAAAEPEGTAVRVSMVRLDDLLVGGGEFGRMEVIKIDVEGSEGAVLRGGQHVLNERRPRLLIEVHSPAALEQCLQQLDAARYDVSPVQPSRFFSDAIAARGASSLPASEFHINHLRCTPR